nr:odorant receptor 13a-like [Megalopta genalis]
MIEVQTDDFAISVASFFMKVAGFWMYVDQAEKRRRNITLFYTVALILFSVYVQVTDFYYTEDDFIGYLFLLVNILTVIGVLFKIFVLLPHRENFFRLVVHLQRHFLNAEYDEYEKTIMHRCKRLCAIFVGLITLFVHLTGICYAVSPVIANIGKNESDRVLPFNMWVNVVPITMTPYYEIAFTVEVLALYQICVTYFCFDNCLCIMNLHVASQFRILQYRLAHLRCIYEKRNSVGGLKICAIMPTKDVYGTLKRYVHQHQVLIAFCKKLEEIFNLVVLGDILAFSIVICLNGCQALMIDSARRFIFIFFLLTSFVHLLMFTYSCDVVMHESLKVAAGIYDSPWCYLTFNDHGRMLRKDVVLIIMRCKFPCCITARRFFPVTLETYTKVWSTAASYFTLLRQTLDDMAILYSLVSFLSVTNGLFKTLVLYSHKKDFLILVDHLRRQFLYSDYNTYERTMVNATKNTCAVFIGLFTFFTHITAFSYILGPLLMSIGKNETDRMFPFNLGPVFSLTPYYEITFFVQSLFVYQSGVCHFCFDNALCIMNLHVATQFRILQYRLSNLKSKSRQDDSDDRVPSTSANAYAIFKRCVQQHQMLIAFCNKLEEVFNLIVFGQMLIFSLVICLNGLQVLMVGKPKKK